MNDVLPDDAALWERFEDAARAVFAQYGYRNMRVPIVETTPLFVRGIGDATDIVEHGDVHVRGQAERREPDAASRGDGRHRPRRDRAFADLRAAAARVDRAARCSATSARRRAATGSSTSSTSRRWASPVRTSTPSRSSMLARLWRALGIADGTRLTINSIGDRRRAPRASRGPHRLFRAPRGAARRRREAPAAHESAAHPRLQEPGHAGNDPGRAEARRRLGAASRAHFDGLQRLLADSGIPFEIDARLVRGLDYYNRTVFEWVTDRLGAQGTVAGGGRYDGLFEQLGGKPHARLRLRHRHRADHPAAAGGRRDRRATRRSPTSSTTAMPPRGSRGGRARCCATPVARSSSTPAAAASSRR